jgi:glucose/arabinose dehydrogenase
MVSLVRISCIDVLPDVSRGMDAALTLARPRGARQRCISAEGGSLTMRRPLVLFVVTTSLVWGLALAAGGRDAPALVAWAAAARLTAAESVAEQQSPSELADPFEVGVKVVAEGLTSPVGIVSAFDGSGRLFILDQIGVIRILTREGSLVAEAFLDLGSKLVTLNPNFDERGLLGLAFHPGYESNGRFFVYYNAPPRPGFDNTATFSEFRVSADPNKADPLSERVFLQLDDPQFNHNGGTLAFGADGFLYISIGDGGAANDCAPGHVEDWYADNCGGNGQDIEQNLFGNILRIDVNGPMPYGVPPDNPFFGTPGLDEIYAYGFRNPYRISFDMATGRLFAGDAGQGLWEEVSLVEKGGNYGWNVKEGTHCFDAENNQVSPAECPNVVESGVRAGDPLIDPIIEYANAAQPGGLGRTVVGGVVYRGRTLRQLTGRYVFADWSRSFGTPDGTLFAATERKKGLWRMQELVISNSANGRINHFVLGFGQDTAGEVYVGATRMVGPSGTTGKVFRLIRPSGN